MECHTGGGIVSTGLVIPPCPYSAIIGVGWTHHRRFTARRGGKRGTEKQKSIIEPDSIIDFHFGVHDDSALSVIVVASW